MEIPKVKCPICRSYIGEILSGTPFCKRCKIHFFVKMGEVVKIVDQRFYKGTNLKDVV